MTQPSPRERADQQVQRLAAVHHQQAQRRPVEWSQHPNRAAFATVFAAPPEHLEDDVA